MPLHIRVSPEVETSYMENQQTRAFANLMAALEAVKTADTQLQAAVKEFQKYVPEESLEQIMRHLGMETGRVEHLCDVSYKGDRGIVRCKRPAGHEGKHGQGAKRSPQKKRKATKKAKSKRTEKRVAKKATCSKHGCTKEPGHPGAHNGRAHHTKRARSRPAKPRARAKPKAKSATGKVPVVPSYRHP